MFRMAAAGNEVDMSVDFGSRSVMIGLRSPMSEGLIRRI